MNEFVEAALSFPTVVFSVLLGVTVVYWGFALLTGGLEVGTGGGGGGSTELLDGLDGGGGSGDGIVSSLTDALGLGTVPTAVILSLLVLFAWFFSLVGTSFVDSLTIGGAAAAALTVAVIATSLALSVGATMLVTRPIGRLFVYTEGQARSTMLGRTCVVRTGRVDRDFGQAEVTDSEGATLVLDVRTADDTHFQRGDLALLIDYDDDLDAYIVAVAD